jgi:Flp pilus assembly CpaF family ATPase
MMSGWVPVTLSSAEDVRRHPVFPWGVVDKKLVGVGLDQSSLVASDDPSILFSGHLPLHQWIYFGAVDHADVHLSTLPLGSLGRFMLLRRGAVVLDVENQISIHAGSFQKRLFGVVVNVCVGLAPEHEIGLEAGVLRFSAFTESAIYSRLEASLLQTDSVRSSRWSGSTLFRPDGLPRQDLLTTLCSVLSPDGNEDPQFLCQTIETALDYLHATLFGFGLLDPMVRAQGVKEVLVNGFNEIYVDGACGLQRSVAAFPCRDALERLVESLLARMDTRLDLGHPVAQGVLAGRYRVHIISDQICPAGPSLSIRCFPERTFGLRDLLGPKGSLSELKELLVGLVQRRKNLLICGETSSGKTSLIEALSGHIPAGERVIVAEDVRELRLANEHKVYLQTHQGFGSSIAEVDLRGLVKESLRMRPDRLIIGECRGAEALDLLQALNTGHEGSMTSIHGSHALAALRRLETLSMFGNARVTRTTASALIASGIHAVIEMRRCPDGRRCVHAVSLVEGQDSPSGTGGECTLRTIFSEGAP